MQYRVEIARGVCVVDDRQKRGREKRVVAGHIAVSGCKGLGTVNDVGIGHGVGIGQDMSVRPVIGNGHDIGARYVGFGHDGGVGSKIGPVRDEEIR